MPHHNELSLSLGEPRGYGLPVLSVSRKRQTLSHYESSICINLRFMEGDRALNFFFALG